MMVKDSDSVRKKEEIIWIKADEENKPLLCNTETKENELSTPGADPRFQQQNQTLRCYQMYLDFYRCEHLLGEGANACTWFKRVFTSICPNEWIEKWDELRLEGQLPLHKYRTHGPFPGTQDDD